MYREIYRIGNRDSLLSDLARGLMDPRWSAKPLVNLKVTLFEGDEEVFEFLGAHMVLHFLVEDIYTDGEADWSQADRLEIDTY